MDPRGPISTQIHVKNPSLYFAHTSQRIIGSLDYSARAKGVFKGSSVIVPSRWSLITLAAY